MPDHPDYMMDFYFQNTKVDSNNANVRNEVHNICLG